MASLVQKNRPPMLGPEEYLSGVQYTAYERTQIFRIEATENILPVLHMKKLRQLYNDAYSEHNSLSAEKEAIFLILTGIGDEIYSTVDACNTSKEMWTAIERLQQDSDPEQARRDKDMQKNLALLAKYYQESCTNLPTTKPFELLQTPEQTEDTTPRLRVSQGEIDMCKQTEQGSTTSSLTKADWLEDTDEEIDEQELEAHYSYMAKIQEVSPEETSSTSQPLEQSIHTLHMFSTKSATKSIYGVDNFANPKYLKKAQSEKPRLYEIPYDTSDPANRFCPNGEETVTLEKESRSKLDKEQSETICYTYQNILMKNFQTHHQKPICDHWNR
ncbi:hypothetical protein Tco_0683307 [Tanacetum coccineum]|uniref:Uncharacterized protein n=1 Tax=Tanacetum coccineum TaxID=301880 RepID=A0ABQ4XVC1_9ASTR